MDAQDDSQWIDLPSSEAYLTLDDLLSCDPELFDDDAERYEAAAIVSAGSSGKGDYTLTARIPRRSASPSVPKAKRKSSKTLPPSESTSPAKRPYMGNYARRVSRRSFHRAKSPGAARTVKRRVRHHPKAVSAHDQALQRWSGTSGGGGQPRAEEEPGASSSSIARVELERFLAMNDPPIGSPILLDPLELFPDDDPTPFLPQPTQPKASRKTMGNDHEAPLPKDSSTGDGEAPSSVLSPPTPVLGTPGTPSHPNEGTKREGPKQEADRYEQVIGHGRASSVAYTINQGPSEPLRGLGLSGFSDQTPVLRPYRPFKSHSTPVTRSHSPDASVAITLTPATPLPEEGSTSEGPSPSQTVILGTPQPIPSPVKTRRRSSATHVIMSSPNLLSPISRSVSGRSRTGSVSQSTSDLPRDRPLLPSAPIGDIHSLQSSRVADVELMEMLDDDEWRAIIRGDGPVGGIRPDRLFRDLWGESQEDDIEGQTQRRRGFDLPATDRHMRSRGSGSSEDQTPLDIGLSGTPPKSARGSSTKTEKTPRAGISRDGHYRRCPAIRLQPPVHGLVFVGDDVDPFSRVSRGRRRRGVRLMMASGLVITFSVGSWVTWVTWVLAKKTSGRSTSY